VFAEFTPSFHSGQALERSEGFNSPLLSSEGLDVEGFGGGHFANHGEGMHEFEGFLALIW
jgi:hypothetical protein